MPACRPATSPRQPACRLSQIHYHFGSKQGLVLALFEYLNAQLLDRQNALFDDPTLKLSEQWDRACDYLDDDIASGYVRVLQELIAASWARRRGRQGRSAPACMGWIDLIIGVAREAERELGRLGPVLARRRSARSPPTAFIGAESLYPARPREEGLAGARMRCGASAISSASRKAASRPEVMLMRAKLPEQGRLRRARRREARTTRSMATARRPCCSCRPGASSTRASTRRSCPISASASAASPMTAAATASPTGRTMSAAYSLDNYVADALAVMDATDAEQAILVGLSFGGLLASHPGRAPSRARQGRHPGRHGRDHRARTIAYMAPQHFYAKREQFEGWDKYNRDYWLANYPDFAEHFIRNIFSEPHSTKQIEDGIAWASETTGPMLVKTVEARAIPPAFDVSEAMYRKIRCPVLFIHGDNDQIQPHGRARGRAAEVTGAELVTIAGGGHNPLGRYPAKCNTLIIDFLDRRLGIRAPAQRRTPAARQARSARSISPRRSASGTAGATSPSRASCASCIPTCRSTGWRRTRSRACSRPAASASIR